MKRIPCATYRLQFNREFTFRQAAEILDYLTELGVSDIYASPLFAAGPDSTHGYDTCSFGQINSNLGTAADFEELTGALKQRGLGVLLDVVPNHMSATLSNPWWFDVLEKGRGSAYARFFDIDWRPNNPALHDKVLLPVLEDDYAKVLEDGKLRLAFEEDRFFISYHERNFPVDPSTLPTSAAADSTRILTEFNGAPGNARSFEKLDALIQRQHYRLAYWKVASGEINYRRFFDVTEMVAIKMELPEVFRATHELIFQWLAMGKVTGLRIDHPDGLWDPKEYLERLQAGLGKRQATGKSPEPADSKVCATTGGERPLYVVVEKILSGDEQLPVNWATEGTTGYDFLNRVNGLFVDDAKEADFDELYRQFTGRETSFGEIVYNSRKQVLERAFASELSALAHRLQNIAERTRGGRDFTFAQLLGATGEIIANFPVYRTYVTEATISLSEQDRKVVERAVRQPRERAGARMGLGVFGFIERILLLDRGSELGEVGIKSAREFVMKFQQLTGPAMAKGLEDTAFYRFNRLISLNEVGGEPGRFGVGMKEFHEANRAMFKRWPHTMLATATHDTKRGEDLRARLNVLSEMPAEWAEAIARWSKLNRDKKTVVDNAPAPDANDEYLFYQTIVGAWPVDTREGLKLFRDRVAAFMLKAVKEAKVHTSWTEANTAYEKALQDFVERVLADRGNDIFLEDAQCFSKRVAFFGRFNSLSQTLLKIASPGVPDFYQGSELWDLNLVDPDNRRTVDYAMRGKLLAGLKKEFESVVGIEFFGKLLRDEEPGAVKLFTIWRALNFRRAQRELFEDGDYLPLSATGEKRDHVCAFARVRKGQGMMVVVPRLVFGLVGGAQLPPTGSEVWKDTAVLIPEALKGGSFRNVLTGEMVANNSDGVSLELARVLSGFPMALLEKV